MRIQDLCGFRNSTRGSRRDSSALRRAGLLAVLALSAPVLAGCAAETSPFRGLARKVGVATETPPPADFVGATRNPGAGYMKIQRELPSRPTPVRPVDQVKGLESSLEGTRARNEAAGASARAEGLTPAPTAPVAPPPVEMEPGPTPNEAPAPADE